MSGRRNFFIPTLPEETTTARQPPQRRRETAEKSKICKARKLGAMAQNQEATGGSRGTAPKGHRDEPTKLGATPKGRCRWLGDAGHRQEGAPSDISILAAFSCGKIVLPFLLSFSPQINNNQKGSQMTTEERLEKLEQDLANANRRNRWPRVASPATCWVRTKMGREECLV